MTSMMPFAIFGGGTVSACGETTFSMTLKDAVDSSHLCRYGQVLTSECHENCEGKE